MRGMGVGGSDAAAAMAAAFSEGVDEVGALPVRVCPSDISPAEGSLLIEGPRASPIAIEGPLAYQPQPKKGGSCRGLKPH